MKNIYKKIKFNYLFIIFILIYVKSFGQFYDLGQDPASTRWMRINTRHYEIIFPADFASEAEKLANILDYSYIHVTTTLDHKPHKIPIIIHNQTTVSNAYAMWAPRRMEYFTCTPQSTYGQYWLEQLGLHEFRHIVQMDLMNQGLSKFVYYLFGEQSTAALFGLYIPSWFMEGDAVATETALSYSGRGRIPEFEMYYRALLMQKKMFTVDKAINGSYKDFIPSDYYFGYNMVAGVRKDYGYKVWSDANKHIARNPWDVRGLMIAGKNTEFMYHKIFNELKNQYNTQASQLNYTAFKVLSSPYKLYNNYSTPFYINDTTILSLKSGLDFEKQFVTISPGKKEKRIFTPGYFNPIRLASTQEGVVFSFNNKKYEELIYSCNKRYITWSEVEYDKRWKQRTWAVIKMYDLKNHKAKTLTHKTRYFAPSMSPDDSRLVVVEVTEDNKFSLVFLDSKNGKILKKFNNSSNDFFITPCWSEDGKNIFTVFMDHTGKKGIIEINYDDFKVKKILEEAHHEIYEPVKVSHYIYFEADYSGINNIYALDLISNIIYQVTSAKFGAFMGDISDDNKKIVYSDYTADGLQAVEAVIDTSLWVPFNKINNNSIKLYETLVKEENNKLVFDSLKIKNYKVAKYNLFSHLFNFHSWVPLSLHVWEPFTGNEDYYAINPGVMLLSQNKISTAFTVLNYGYNLTDKTNNVSGSFIYKGWYPVISATYSYGLRRSYFDNYLNEKNIDFTWNESVASLDFSLPLNFTKNRYFRSLTLTAGWNQICVYKSHETPDSVYTGQISALIFNVSAYNLIKMSDRDIASRWGQIIIINYKTSVLNNFAGNLFSFQSSFLFPGVFEHNVIKLGYGYQEIMQDKYRFNSEIIYPRGITTYGDKSINTFSFDYKFPFWYPDYRIGSLLYFQRFKNSFFFDYGAAVDENNKQVEYKTTGFELTTDIHVFRSIIPFMVGLRYINNLNNNYSSSYQFLFAVNFDSF